MTSKNWLRYPGESPVFGTRTLTIWLLLGTLAAGARSIEAGQPPEPASGRLVG